MFEAAQIYNLATRVLAVIGWTLLGVLILYLAVRLYDWLDPIDYQAEIQRGTVAAAIRIAAVMIGLAAIVVAAIVT